METIVAAALRLKLADAWVNQGYPTELIVSAPPPARHHSLLHPVKDHWDWELRIHPDDQGFLTSAGRFVGRKEALDIAERAGQIDPTNRKSGSSSNDLFSEDLW
jgi:hypothetical protein